MLLAPNRRRTRRRTSSVKRGVFSKDYCSHIKLDGWKNAYLSANPDLIPEDVVVMFCLVKAKITTVSGMIEVE
jgi:hypothetical protein